MTCMMVVYTCGIYSLCCLRCRELKERERGESEGISPHDTGNVCSKREIMYIHAVCIEND